MKYTVLIPSGNYHLSLFAPALPCMWEAWWVGYGDTTSGL